MTVALTLESGPLKNGGGVLLVELADPEGKPVDDARLELVGNMTHAGMVPVEGTLLDHADGKYRVRMIWSMAGDWFVDVRFTLVDGRVVTRRFPISVHSQ